MKKEIFNIIERETGEKQGSYERGNYTKFEFSSVESARSSNCHDIYKNKVKYRIDRYVVTVELVREDVDPPSQEEILEESKKRELENKMDSLGLVGLDRVEYIMFKLMTDECNHEKG